MAPSLCGGILTDKRSMVAFTWSLTTVLTIVAFFTSIVYIIKIHSHYRFMEKYVATDDYYEKYYNNNYEGEEDGSEDNKNDSNDEKYEQVVKMYKALAQMSAKSVTFVAVYTVLLAMALSLYGTTAIVGFTSLRGVYIAPCFSSSSINDDKMKVGIFGGAIVVFANLLLVCAIILGEVRVEDFQDQQQEGGANNNNNNRETEQGSVTEPYQIKRISTVLAVTFMFLSALYTIFAVLLFLCHASGDETDDPHHHRDSGTTAGLHVQLPETRRRDTSPPTAAEVVAAQGHSHTIHPTTLVGSSPGFITMENSSQGTA